FLIYPRYVRSLSLLMLDYPSTTAIYTLSLHDALPIFHMSDIPSFAYEILWEERQLVSVANLTRQDAAEFFPIVSQAGIVTHTIADRKSTRLNSSHVKISYAVFCLKKKNHLIRLRRCRH